MIFKIIEDSNHRGSTTIVTKPLLLVANKQPDSALRIFLPVQFSIKFFRTGQKNSDFSYLESLDFYAFFFAVLVEPLSYPEVIPLSYLLDGSVWRQVSHWIENGLKTRMDIVLLVVLFQANNYCWTLDFCKQRKSLPDWYYQAIKGT